MVCKPLLILLVSALAPTRAFRRKASIGGSMVDLDTTNDDYLPVCAKEIVKETCDMLVGGLKSGDLPDTMGWLSIDTIQELMSANEESMKGLFEALGLPSTMPTKEQLAGFSEGAKKTLQNYGMKIASNEKGEKYLSLACEDLCDLVRKYVEEKYVLPPSSDIMGMTTSDGIFEWSIDVRPEALEGLWKDGDMPQEGAESPGVYSTATSADGSDGNATATQQPIGPSTLEYTKWAIVKGVAQLFRFYPEQGVASTGSLLQASFSQEVVQDNSTSSELVFNYDDAVKVGKKGIAYVKKIIREIELPGTVPKLKEWFGNNAAATKTEVVRVLNSVHNVMENVHYHYKGPKCEDKTFAYVYSRGQDKCSSADMATKACRTNAEDKFIYYLCDLYVTTDDGEKVETLVHEGSHHADAYTNDVCSDHYHDKNRDICDKKAYGRDTCADIAIVDAARALKNADNHCYFVQAVADPAYVRGHRCAKGSRSLSWFADKDGNCRCPQDSPCFNGNTRGCQSANNPRSSGFFLASCTTCKCKTPAPKTTCPSFALSSTPDGDGDCECPVLTKCKDGDYNCPSYSRGSSAHYFRSTCTTCRCVDKPQILLLSAGDIVKVKTQFDSNSRSATPLPVNLIGKVIRVDGDGDGYVEFDSVGNQWVLKNNFVNLMKIELHVGDKVKVTTAFTSISRSATTLSVNLVGTVSSIDSASDAKINFDGVGHQWVSWKSFDKLEVIESSSKVGVCAGATGPDEKGDCRCPASTKCLKKTGGKCLTTEGEPSTSLFDSTCTDCECNGPDKRVVPPQPIDDREDKPSEKVDPDNGSPFAHKPTCAALMSVFVSFLV